MIVKLTSKRQVTFPARVLEVLGVEPGDQLEFSPTARRRVAGCWIG
ncbi:MAG TPA: AbrB/MazE/SpoVT family DNA-binding domain-containing protein [Thermoanaerobaculia bacterium]|nr:AbrB/MazE/SpoVT family DNA-binding domain-containing protein [Thermoanaerobaculia bacterium]